MPSPFVYQRIIYRFTQLIRETKKWRDITNAVTFCLSKDSLPIYTVDKLGFRHLLEKMDPQYDLPSSKYLSKVAIPALYEETRQKLESDLKEVGFFSATTDIWSSITGEPYISYTVHYINPDWNLESECLQTLFFPADHPAQNIAEILQDTLDQWGLKPKIKLALPQIMVAIFFVLFDHILFGLIYPVLVIISI